MRVRQTKHGGAGGARDSNRGHGGAEKKPTVHGTWHFCFRGAPEFFSPRSGDGAARAKGSKMGVEDDTDRLYRNKVILAPMVRSVS